MFNKASGYLLEQIKLQLKSGVKVAVPEDALEKDGYDLDEMKKYFYTSKGRFGLIHFMGIKRIKGFA